MNTSTRPTFPNDRSGNKSKPMLAEADFSEQKDGYFTTEKQPLIRFKIVKDIDPIFACLLLF